MARHSFNEDRTTLLERFGHRGTPAALEDQIAAFQPKKRSRRRCPSFVLNQTLFEKSQL